MRADFISHTRKLSQEMLECLVKEESESQMHCWMGGQSLGLASLDRCGHTASCVVGCLQADPDPWIRCDPAGRLALGWSLSFAGCLTSGKSLLLPGPQFHIRQGRRPSLQQWSPTCMQPEGSENTHSWAPPLGIWFRGSEAGPGIWDSNRSLGSARAAGLGTLLWK